jgi:hypothetical protein
VVDCSNQISVDFLERFLAGCFFSLVLSTFLAHKVGQAVYTALKNFKKEEELDDDNDPNWWKKGRRPEDD